MTVRGNDIIALVTGGALEYVSSPPSGDVFPTLSKNPDSSNFTEQAAVDPTIKSDYENGSVQTRARFTAIPRAWTVTYRFLPQNDMELVKAFEGVVKCGAGAFNWTNAQDSQTYNVRFAGPINYRLEPENPMSWQIDFKLIEAYPNSSETE